MKRRLETDPLIEISQRPPAHSYIRYTLMQRAARPSAAPTLSATGCADRTSKPWNVTRARHVAKLVSRRLALSRAPFWRIFPRPASPPKYITKAYLHVRFSARDIFFGVPDSSTVAPFVSSPSREHLTNSNFHDFREFSFPQCLS